MFCFNTVFMRFLFGHCVLIVYQCHHCAAYELCTSSVRENMKYVIVGTFILCAELGALHFAGNLFTVGAWLLK